MPVAPMMPTKENDEQQIMKKRHIGNDNVHIVWTENTEEYDTKTIKSHFNFAHVIVHPMDERLFRVSARFKTKEAPVGPLMETVVLPPEAVPMLTRWTAICADVMARTATQREYGEGEIFLENMNMINN